MSQRQPDDDTQPPAPPEPPPRPRRRWRRWLLAFLLLIVVVVALLPTLLSMSAVRQRLLSIVFAPLGVEVSVNHASVGWFSTIEADGIDVRMTGGQNSVSIREIRGDKSLLGLLFGAELGTYRIVEPVVHAQIDPQRNNLARLLGALAGLNISPRPVHVQVVNASVFLQREGEPADASQQPWTMKDLQIDLTMTPAALGPLGVPTVSGRNTRLLNEAELTPQMCNDLLMYAAPVLAMPTRASGRVSLDLDEYSWPIGKPDKATLKGRLSLHSVEIGPGMPVRVMAGVIGLGNLPSMVRVAKDNVVDFHMQDGRVYHENLAFGLADVEPERLIRSRGSVGLDQTLDWYVELPPLGNRLPEGPLRDALLQQDVTLHITGTLAQPRVQLAPQTGQATGAVQALGDWLRQRAESREDGQRQPLFPNRRRKPPAP